MYDPATYWGQSKAGVDLGLDHPIHKIHFDNILAMLKDKGIESVLEIGAGYGRITRLLVENLPDLKHYDALEISPYRAQAAIGYVPPRKFLNIIVDNFESFKATRMYDLVISVECLMHQLPSKIEAWIRKMIALSKRFVMNLDWYEENYKGPIAEWNFIHDYEDLYLSFGVNTLDSWPISSNQWLYLAEVDQLSRVPPYLRKSFH